jgi:glycosyltransferase involved in cell wall biosynthesis
MLTYNHAAYLEQAVNSVLAQEFAHPYEIVIGDDCSTDATLVVARRLESQHPGTIRVLAAERNLGITPNFMRLLAACRAPYIAMLEEDDYWVDTRKLQSQFDMLEADKSLSCCAGLTQNREFWAVKKPRYSLDDLLRRYIFHTSALFFRRDWLPDLTPFCTTHALDSLLFAFLAEKGDCGFIDRELSYYRRHAGGAWTGTADAARIRATRQVTDTLSTWFNHRQNRALYNRELWVYRMMCRTDLRAPLVPQLWRNARLMMQVFPRIFRVLPGQALTFAASILLQPLTATARQLRFKLGLGRNLKQFFSGNAPK